MLWSRALAASMPSNRNDRAATLRLICKEDPMNTAVPLKTTKAQPLILPEHRDAFYGGKWHKVKSGRSGDAINPGTGESLGTVAECGTEDIDAAVAAAKAAFPAWRDTPPL